MIREISEYDPDRAQQVLQWPVREGILRYVYLLRERARDEYKLAVLAWAPQAPYAKGDVKPPAVPKILRGQ